MQASQPESHLTSNREERIMSLTGLPLLSP
jgi:hypothetical protein